MRKLVIFIASLVFAILLGVPGVLLALQVGLVLYRLELAFDWALHVAEHWPLALTTPAVQLANHAIQRNLLIPAGMIAAIMCLLAFRALRNAQRLLRPSGESDDGKARIALKADHPRVGSLLEGSLQLTKDAKPGDIFRVELFCRRSLTSVSEKRRQTVFSARQDVQAVQGAEGWSVPFQFDVPATAPPSMVRDPLAVEGYGHGFDRQLAFYPANAWIAFPSEFSLQLAAAPEEELHATEAGDTADRTEAIGAIGQGLGGGAALPYGRAALRALPSDDLAMAKKISGMPARIMKWGIILFFVVPTAIIVLMLAAATMLGR